MSTEHQPEGTSASPQDEAKANSPEAKPANTPPTAGGDAPAEAEARVAPKEAETQPELFDESVGGDDGAEEGDEEAAAGGPPGEGTAPQGEKKKRRRRRRKKKPAGEGATAAGAAGAAGEGGEGGEPKPEGEGGEHTEHKAGAEGGGEGHKRKHEKKKREHRPHEERERPAFNQGDIVFGKVIEFNEDVIFIDLSGKAKALFDLKELLITEEEDAQPVPEEEDEEVEAKAEAGAEASANADANAEADANADAHADANANADANASADANAADASAEAVARRRIVQPRAPEPVPAPEAAAEAAPEAAATTGAEASGDGATAETAETAQAEKKPEPASPAPQAQLPRVVLEAGAPFVGVVHNDGGRGGLVVLTHHPKRASRSKPNVSKACKEHTQVQGIVTGVIKGGVEVDVDGLRAFAPGSHMDLRLGTDLHPLIGKRLPFFVTQYGKRGHNVVLSRRELLEEAAKGLREEALKNLVMGSTVEGTVRTVVQFGAFVDVGGVEGLVPLSEMSHNRADTPKDVFKVGEKVNVKILRVDEKGKLWLSRRATIADPWSTVAQKYAPGTKHTGKVARLQPFGAFIELESGVDGLIHTGDLSIKRIEHPSEVVKVGDSIDVVVASVDPSHHKIGLHPAPTGEAAGEIPQRVQLHKVVKVVVVAVEANGLVVRVLGATGRSARGFITASGTGTPKNTELRKVFPVGKEIEAKITEMDPRRGDIRLSIKAVNEDNERNAFQQYRAQVKREAKFGTFADLLKKVNVPKE